MDKPLTTIIYKLADGKRICLVVTMEVKSLLEQADRKIRSQRRKERRRHTEYIDGLTDTTMVLPQEDFANLISRIDSYKRLHAAIETLSDARRRRVYLHYFGGFTCRKIAESEKVSFEAVSKSLVQARKALCELLTR
ncbi:MAG: hypothetical protein LBS19_05030 [Clostridiales bacterium]|jgi:DNA-directed RNA polymerase specialized sigma24 family protein|nr:hypothetical protein [Clostridiales bacterium]